LVVFGLQDSQIEDPPSNHLLYVGHRRTSADQDQGLRLVNAAHFVLESLGFSNFAAQQSAASFLRTAQVSIAMKLGHTKEKNETVAGCWQTL